MKKKIIILTLFITIIILCIVSTIKLNTLEKEKPSFKSIMEKENFLITDTTSTYNDPLVVKSYIFYNNYYQIEYIEFDNEENAKIAFNANIKSFETKDNTIEDIDTHKTYTIYTYITDNTYVYLRYEKNTLIYINTDIKYKQSISKLLKKLI